MKRRILACFYLCVASALFARDAVIDKVEAFERGGKTSVIISYSGTEKLRYFALDSTDGVFSLDLPGVYSRFDFSTLAFTQVTEVRQLPLDPDVSNGISVRFFLVADASYQIFESDPGQLTLLFEGAEDHSQVAVQDPIAAKQTLVDASFRQTLSGPQGERRLSELTLEANASGGRITLTVDQLERYTQFFLENPKRFVLDMRGAVLSLNENDMPLEHPLVSQVRVRQFQTRPEAITRLVLDLNGETQVRVVNNPNGVLIVFADNAQSLASLIEHPEASGLSADSALAVVEVESAEELAIAPAPMVENVESNKLPVPEETLAEEAPVAPSRLSSEDDRYVDQAADLDMDRLEEESEIKVTPEDANLVPDMPVSQQHKAEFEVAVAESTLADQPDDQVAVVETSDMDTAEVEAIAEPVVLAEPEAPEVEVASSSVANLSDIAPEQVVETAAAEQVVETETGLEPILLAPEIQVSESTVETHVAPAAAKVTKGHADRELSEFLAASDKPEAEVKSPALLAKTGEAKVSPVKPAASAVAPSENAVAQTSPAPQHQEAKTPELEPVAAVAVTDDKVAAVSHDEPVALNQVEVPPTAKAPAPEPERAKETFVMASDVDLDMEDFRAQGTIDKTLFHQMKGVKSTVHERKPVVVTNNRIASKKLVETSNMQEDKGASGDFADLFKEESDPFQSVNTEEVKYRGFDIMIDIRDQPVVDLLRFLADEVGFNLFVDNTVGNVRATYKFHNIPWDQALDIILTNANLDKEFRNGVLRVATTEKFRAEERARAELRIQRELSVPTETVTVELNYAKARDMVPIVNEYLSPRGSIIRDDRTNILIIRDIPKFMVEIRTLINRLDKRIPQVSIEARIVETSTRFLRELGVQWGLTAQYSPETGTDTGIDFPHRVNLGGPRIGQPRSVANGPEGGYAVNFPVVNANAVGMGLTLGNFLDNFKLDISMQLLESDGQGQVISSPKVTTQNNKQAVITNGQRIPIQTLSRTGVITSRYVDAVLELEVTPQITADETIIMNLIVDKSETDFSQTVLGNPVINIRRAETQVLVKNGGTAVIGGIFTLNEQNTTIGLPVVRKIPVLKRLFSSERKQYTNQELLIFVTAKIVKY